MGEGMQRAFTATRASRDEEPIDVVARVPKTAWLNWLAEGDWPGEPATERWGFSVGRPVTKAYATAERCYVVAWGQVRGYAPLVSPEGNEVAAFVRGGGAVAMTVPGLVLPGGQWNWMYRGWRRAEEVPFPDWATAGLPDKLAADVRKLERLRLVPSQREEIKHRALLGLMRATDLFRGMKGG